MPAARKPRKSTARKAAPRYARKPSAISRFGGSRAPSAFRARTYDQSVAYVSTYFEMKHTGNSPGASVQPNLELNVPCWPTVNGMTHGQNTVCTVHSGDAAETEVTVAAPLAFRKLAMIQQLWHQMRVKSVTVKVTLGSTQLENPLTFQHDTGDTNLVTSPLQAVTGAHKSYLPTISSRTFVSTYKPRSPADWEFHSTIGSGPAAGDLNFIKLFQRLESGSAATARVEITYVIQTKDSRNDILTAAQQAPMGN